MEAREEPSTLPMRSDLSGLVVLAENVERHVVDGSIIEYYETAVGTRLYVHRTIFPELIVHPTEVIADRLNSDVKLVGNTVGGTIGQAVFDSAELVECDCFTHDSGIYEVIVRFNFDLLI